MRGPWHVLAMARMRISGARVWLLAGGMMLLALNDFAVIPSSVAQTVARGTPQTKDQPVSKPFDARLLRLSEILGAVHHLREICGANEGQLWRDQMTEIMKAEQPPALLRGRMVAAFNSAYRSYQRTYGTCTPSAKTATTRFFAEGMVITKGLAEEFKGDSETKKADTLADPQAE